MTDKIVVEDLYKVFGPDPDEALRLLEQGLNKDEIFEKTGNTVGVQQASFSIQEGEIFVIMGLSGSGKSTMVRMLNRLIEPTRGSVYIDGQDVTSMSKSELINLRRHDMSMVFQSFALMPHRTVLENAAFGLEVAGTERGERENKALEALEQVGLKANANSYPDELSGGMQQRVGLARALAVGPSIMLMDEAFSALDPLIRTEMQDELLALQQKHKRTVVFISHDLDEAMRIGDRIAIMQGGFVVQVGTPEEIVSNPANDYVRSFFYGVDVSQVYTAGDIANRKQVTVIERPGMSVNAALERMRQHDRDVAVVIDRGRQYQGTVSMDSLNALLDKGGEPEYADAFLEEVEPIPDDTPMQEVVGKVAGSRWPLPVVDADGKYLGSISKTSILRTLDRTG
ncbi:Glycine betaine/choline transport system ATP-binding protein OusV [wastewater metagenome]|uniref:Glycine betaine/choline transport system ATP-binding protein OusV n=3 Tax=root TaxID=1 RepID=A0A5B8R7C2_9ZZZZ|nr:MULTISPECIES: glycine betaine/L-proline ABC transporter ATP-binding protein ProV [Arhodomonas]QEA04530.1 glycine betaine/choline transport system ATP-binding protein OusV [uncultured organism]